MIKVSFFEEKGISIRSRVNLPMIFNKSYLFDKPWHTFLLDKKYDLSSNDIQ